METIFLERIKEVKNNLNRLERALNVKIEIKGKNAIINGDSLNEYESLLVFEAINFGFSAERALILKNEDFAFRKILIKKFTKRRNLTDVKSRIIGTEGRTKRTLSNLTDSDIIVKDNSVGIISDIESLEDTITAITNLIRGSKQANVYKYLEKMNQNKKKKELE